MVRLFRSRSGGAAQDFALAAACLAAVSVVGAGLFERVVAPDRGEITGSITSRAKPPPPRRASGPTQPDSDIWATVKSWLQTGSK